MSETAVDVSASTGLTANMAFHCHALEELDLAPLLNQSWGQPAALVPVPTLELYRHLSSLQNLRILRASLTAFDSSALAVIGRLPHLEALHISDVSPCCFLVPVLALSDDAFPALQKLWLSYIDVTEFKSIWSIQRLVTRPVIVHVGLCQLGLEDDTEAAELLSDICQSSPQIVDLTFGYETAQHLSPDSFRALKCLPLKKLSIFAVRVTSPEAMCEILSTTCPLLYELRLPTLCISISDLRYFAQLSHLEFLSVSVDWQSCTDLNELAPKPPFISPAFRRLDEIQALHNSPEPALINKTILYVLLSFKNGYFGLQFCFMIDFCSVFGRSLHQFPLKLAYRTSRKFNTISKCKFEFEVRLRYLSEYDCSDCRS